MIFFLDFVNSNEFYIYLAAINDANKQKNKEGKSSFCWLHPGLASYFIKKIKIPLSNMWLLCHVISHFLSSLRIKYLISLKMTISPICFRPCIPSPHFQVAWWKGVEGFKGANGRNSARWYAILLYEWATICAFYFWWTFGLFTVLTVTNNAVGMFSYTLDAPLYTFLFGYIARNRITGYSICLVW